MRKKHKFLGFALSLAMMTTIFAPLSGIKAQEEAPASYGPVPTQQQLAYSKDERAAFIHFGVNTFTDKEWGDGKEDPAIFNPTELDPEQWAKVLAESGFKKVIITAKHHDGFSLFDSPGTDHDITNEAINEKIRGRDIVKELSVACKKYQLKFGVYLSPWDQNSEHYGDDRGDDYNTYFMNQLRKLLTEYGDISEVWFDGAKGSNVTQTYYFDKWFALVKELQPNALIFSDMGPDVRWIGNENGYAGEPCWSKIKGDTLTLPHYDTDYLNHGDPDGTHWIMGESDTSIRPGWFYHENQKAKSLDQLVDIYFNSVGRNSTLLLNVPPNKQGLIKDADAARLSELNTVLQNTFEENLAADSAAQASSIRYHNPKFAAENVTDDDYDSYWTMEDDRNSGSITVDLGEEKIFDIISLQEYIPLGQRIEQFNVEVYNETIGWQTVYEGQTIGYKRLIRLAPMSASKVRLNIVSSQAVPIINTISVYKADRAIEIESNVPAGLKVIDDQAAGDGMNQIKYEGTWDDRKSESDFYNTSSHWTKTPGAKATLTFTGSKFYILSATDPNHGIFNMKIDGGETIEVDNYHPDTFTPQQIVYESEELSYGEHTVELVLAGKNNHGGGTAAHLDAFYILDNESGMIEIADDEIMVREDAGKVEIPIRRVGGTKGEVSVSFSLESGTAIQDKDFQRMIENVVLEDGQKEATASVVLFDNDERDGNKYFHVRINKVIGAMAGTKSKTTIHIIDDDAPLNLAYQKKVTVSSIEDDLPQFEPGNIVDGNSDDTRWSSEYTDDQWVTIDLGQEEIVNEVALCWEDAYASQYKIMTSIDGEVYDEVAFIEDGKAGWNQHVFEPVTARYVKVQMLKRASKFGYSIIEMEVYGPKSTPVDKSELQTAYDEVKGYAEKDYTAESWTGFKAALDQAATVLADDSATASQVSDALTALNKAKEALVKAEDTTFMKILLKSAMDKAEALIASDDFKVLAPNVQAMINVRLREATAVYNDDKGSIETCKTAWLNLADALHYAGFKADKTMLKALIDECEAINTDKYTEASVKAFKDALAEANTVYADQNALQERIDATYSALSTAKDGLTEQPTETVDKSILLDLINTAKGKVAEADKYVKNADWEAFVDALAKAEKVYANENATQEEVNKAATELSNAYMNIRLIPSEEMLKQLEDFINYTKKINRALYSAKDLKVIDDAANKAQEMFDKKGFNKEEFDAFTITMGNVMDIIDNNKIVKPNDKNDGKQNGVKAPGTSDTTNAAGLFLQLIAGCGVMIISKKRKTEE